MQTRAILSVLAIAGVVVLVALSPGIATTKNETMNSDTNANSIQALEPKTTRLPLADNSISPANSVATKQCEVGKDDRSSELCAQWKAADAAAESAFWAQAVFWLSLIGTIGLLVTLWYTRAAVRTAQKATVDADDALNIAARNADATAELVRVSQDTAKRRLRAYLSVLPLEIEGLNSEDGPICLTVPIQNAGQTPVANWSINWRWAVSDVDPTSAFFDGELQKNKEPDTPGEFAFGPLQTKPLKLNLDIAQPWRKEVLSRSKRLYILGRITYVDCFNDSHRTEFFYGYNSDHSTPFGQMPVRNRMT